METSIQEVAKVETDNATAQIELKLNNQIDKSRAKDRSSIEDVDVTKKIDVEYKYTDILLNMPPSLVGARVIILLVFFVIGSICSYQGAIILELQEKKATFRDQALFTISSYPFIFKVIFAPLVDLFYFEKVGKCKTWIIGSSSVLALVLIIVAPWAETFIDPHKVGGLTALWFCINLVTVFLTISAEMFIVKIFEEDDKSKGSMLLDLGWSIGGFFSYNLFVPLNSVTWLNNHVFQASPVSKPIISHKAMVFGLASTALIYAVAVLIFVGEKKTELNHPRLSLVALLNKVGKFFTQPTMRNFLGYIALMRIFRYLLTDTLMLKIINGGVAKTTIVNIDTVTFPLYIVVSVCFMRLMSKGKVMKLYSSMLLYAMAVLVVALMVLNDLETHHNSSRTSVFLVLISIMNKFSVDGPFLMGFINLITPHDIGSTFITFMMCWQNLTQIVPSSIGLEIVHRHFMNFNVFACICVACQTILILAFMNYSNSLDDKDKEE